MVCLCVNTAICRPPKAFRHDALYRLPNQSLDCFHRQLVDRRDDRDGLTLLTRSARATYSVYVVFRNIRHVIIDDVRDGIDIQSTSRDVCGHEHSRMAIAKRAQRCFTLWLASIGVNAIYAVISGS